MNNKTGVVTFPCFTHEQVREINKEIKKNITQQEKYTKRNSYDRFSILNNRIPQKEFHAVVVPDYIKLMYTCTIWTDYVTQMNKLIEMINYTSDSYWGDKERFKFNCNNFYILT